MVMEDFFCDIRTSFAYVRRSGPSYNNETKYIYTHPLVEIGQKVPCRAIRGNSISVNSTLPPLGLCSVLCVSLYCCSCVVICWLTPTFIHSFSVPHSHEGYIGDELVRTRFIVPLLRFAGRSQLEQYRSVNLRLVLVVEKLFGVVVVAGVVGVVLCISA